MNGAVLERIASAGPVFLAWHFLTLIICCTGLLLERGLRKGNPHVRSSLLRLTLLLALAVPVVSTILNQLPPSLIPVERVEQNPNLVAPQQRLPEFPPLDWDHVAVWRPIIANLGQLQNHLVTSSRSGRPLLQIFYETILGFSFLVSLFLATRFVLAIFYCVSLQRRGRPVERSVEERCQVIATAMGVSIPQMLTVNGLKSPLLVGFLKSAILLPEGIQVRDEIYSHELTHLSRNDMGWHLFSRLATILMPLQPGFWLLKNAMARADEDVCDDMVLARGADRTEYAELLLSVAESQHSPNRDLCLPMAAFHSHLEHRLLRLMDTARPLASQLSFFVLTICLTPLAIVGVLTGAIYFDAERPLRAEDGRSAQVQTLSALTPVVRSIDVEFIGLCPGPAKESEAKIIAESGLQLGDPCQVSQLNRAVKNIFATGQAENVQIRALPAGGAVNVTIFVQTNPTVKKLSFQGISGEEEAKIRPLLHIKEGLVGSDYLVFSDAKLITSELAKRGLHAAVTATANTFDPNQTLSSVIFTVTAL